MKIPSMFKTPSPKGFEFKPRYYDAEKEAFEERINKAKAEASTSVPEAEAVKHRIRNHFQNRKKATNKYSSRASNIRIIIIIAVLTALSFWILK